MGLPGRLFALIYDPLVSVSERVGLSERRRRLVSQARGRVLEIGAGTGRNVPYYPAGLDELVLVEPLAPMARRLERRLRRAGRTGTVVRAPAESLPFEDASFDTVVATMVLCSVADVARSLAEVRRVLAPGGRFLFLEHVRAADPKVARRQDRLRGPWAWFARGCRCNQATVELLDGPFALERLEHDRLPVAPSILRPIVIGAAVAR